MSYDRGRKLQKYAERGVREVWIVNVKEQIIEQYREPQGNSFVSSKHYRRGDSIGLVAFPEISFEVDDLIG